MSSNPSAPRRFAALDGARGLAVLFVLADHLADSDRLRLIPGMDLDRAGFFGVLLFFVLSAFLLTFLFFIQPKENLAHPTTWLNYVLRRFLRIFPLYTLAVLAMAWVHPDFVRADVFNHLLLKDGQEHFWTIAVEVKYYFILPAVVLIAGLALFRRWKSVAIAGAAVFAITYFGGGFLETIWSMDEDVWLSEYLGVFLAGSATGIFYALFLRSGRSVEKYRTWIEAAGWLALGIVILRIPSVYTLLFRPAEEVNKLDGDLGILAALWSIFILAALLGRGWLQTALSVAPLRWLGLISYSVYLWHPFVLDYAEELAQPAYVCWLVFLVGTGAISTLTYWVVERPLGSIRLPAPKPGAAPPEPTLSQPTV
ncbi:MAG: acyltransferase family protein [Chthoniobacteraceae bacterium]